MAVPADEMARRREVETQAVAAGGGGVAVGGTGRSGGGVVAPVPFPGEPTLERTMSPGGGT